jgi:hypothetical protein
MVFVLMQSACNKENQKSQTNAQTDAQQKSISVSDRTEDLPTTETYYIDELPVSQEMFKAAPESYPLHSVQIPTQTEIELHHYLFTTRQKHESWGDVRGYCVSGAYKADDRVKALADSYGIDAEIATEEDFPANFEDQVKQIQREEECEMPSGPCYLQMKLGADMCDMDAAPTTPFSCSGWNYVMWYPGIETMNKNILTAMNNRASVWKPKNECFVSITVSLRGYDKIYFLKPIGTITTTIPGNSANFIPFRSSLAPYNDVISSFRSWRNLL